MWDCVIVMLKIWEREWKKNEREKNKKIEPFLDDLLVLKPLVISLSQLFFIFFGGASPERVMVQTQQFSKNSNTQLMASCKKM